MVRHRRNSSAEPQSRPPTHGRREPVETFTALGMLVHGHAAFPVQLGLLLLLGGGARPRKSQGPEQPVALLRGKTESSRHDLL
jgi:hypothetical protein